MTLSVFRVRGDVGVEVGEETRGHFVTLIENLVHLCASLDIERVSIECRKTKTKVITFANQKGRRQSCKPIKTRSNYT